MFNFQKIEEEVITRYPSSQHNDNQTIHQTARIDPRGLSLLDDDLKEKGSDYFHQRRLTAHLGDGALATSTLSENDSSENIEVRLLDKTLQGFNQCLQSAIGATVQRAKIDLTPESGQLKQKNRSTSALMVRNNTKDTTNNLIAANVKPNNSRKSDSISTGPKSSVSSKPNNSLFLPLQNVINVIF